MTGQLSVPYQKPAGWSPSGARDRAAAVAARLVTGALLGAGAWAPLLAAARLVTATAAVTVAAAAGIVTAASKAAVPAAATNLPFLLIAPRRNRLTSTMHQPLWSRPAASRTPRGAVRLGKTGDCGHPAIRSRGTATN